MNKKIIEKINSKRESIIYIVLFLWIYMGVISLLFDRDLNDLSVYFLSLTGFVMSYIFGESVRKTTCTSIMLRGKSSKREMVTYIIIIIWFVLGNWIILTGGDMIGASTYFASLTPFIGAYILGETYKKEPDSDNQNTEA